MQRLTSCLPELGRDEVKASARANSKFLQRRECSRTGRPFHVSNRIVSADGPCFQTFPAPCHPTSACRRDPDTHQRYRGTEYPDRALCKSPRERRGPTCHLRLADLEDCPSTCGRPPAEEHQSSSPAKNRHRDRRPECADCRDPPRKYFLLH